MLNSQISTFPFISRSPFQEKTKQAFKPVVISVSSLPLGYSVEERHPSDMQEILPAWQDLALRALEHNVFSDPAFMAPALQHLPEGRQVRVFLVWRNMPSGQVLRGVFPVVMPKWGLSAGEVRLWQPPLSSSATPLIDRLAPETTINAFLQYLALQKGHLTGLVIAKMTLSGAFATALRNVTSSSKRETALFDQHERAALVPSENPVSDNKLEREMRRLKRRLSETGEVTLVQAQDPRQVRDAIEIFLTLEASGWKGKRGSAMLQEAGESSFVRTMTRDLARQRRCRVDLLKVNGVVIAAGIVLRCGDTAYYWKTAYDENYARFSPGLQLTYELTKKQLEKTDLALTDSCAIQNHPMINQVWHQRIEIADLWVAVRPERSTLALAGRIREQMRRRVRSMAKQAYYKLALGK